MDTEAKPISRKGFLKLATVGLAGTLLPRGPKNILENLHTEILQANSYEQQLASIAAGVAGEPYVGLPYDWEQQRSCSTFVGSYFHVLGFPQESVTAGESNYRPTPDSPMPVVTTVLQVPWLRTIDAYHQRQFGAPPAGVDIPLSKLISDPNLWDHIRPGTAMYFQRGEGHQGYNMYYHTAVFVGISEGVPQFAHYAPNHTSGPRIEPLHDVLAMYQTRSGYNIEPVDTGTSTPKYLTAYAFDTLAVSRRLQKENGPVTPDISSSMLAQYNPDTLITVNINDGTTTLWKKNNNHQYVQTPFVRNGTNQKELYAVLGRHLKINPDLTQAYSEFASSRRLTGALYDGQTGTYWKNGVSRRTYTPPIISRLIQFERIANFGNLGPSSATDIAVIRPLTWSEKEVTDATTENSHYTIHEIPRGTSNQEILLREPDLIAANDPNGPNHGPLRNPALLNRSSGCINYDRDTWKAIKDAVQGDLSSVKKVLTVFASPRVPFDTLNNPVLRDTDPFGGIRVTQWSYDAARDRINYVPPSFDTTE